jgi:hypothetical protein
MIQYLLCVTVIIYFFQIEIVCAVDEYYLSNLKIGDNVLEIPINSNLINDKHTYYINNLRFGQEFLTIPIHSNYSALQIGINLCLTEGYIEYFQKKKIRDCINRVGNQIIYSRSTYNPLANSMLYMNEPIFPPLLNPYYIDKNFIYDDDNETCDINSMCNEKVIVNGNTKFTELDEIINNNRQFAINNNIINVKDSHSCPSRHSHIEQEYYSSLSNNINNFQTSKNRGAIVILAQAGAHSSYENRSTSIVELMRSLDHLYTNYNDQFHDDIWIFHEGDFTNSIQRYVRKARKEIRFFHLKGENWEEYPNFVKDQIYFKGIYNFSVGYRKMIRWYAIR